MALVSQLEGVALGLIQQNMAVKVVITFGLVGAGLVIARLAGHLTRYIWEVKLPHEELPDRIRRRSRSPDRAVEYAIVVLTLAAAVLYINASAASQIAAQVAAYTPRAITAVLVLTLGVILVNGLIAGVRAFIDRLDVKQQVETIGVSPRVLEGFLSSIKIFLYLIVLEVAVIQLGVSARIIDNTLTAASYGVVLLLVLLGFFGFRDLIQNYAAGIYLRGSEVLKPGQRIKLDEATGEIRETSMFSTTVNTDSGYFLLAPNKNLMDREILFKRVKADVETLEDITDHFAATDAPYAGAATAEMALAMFGFDITQGDISEELDEEGPSPAELGAAVEELAGGEVKHAFVAADRMTDAGTELKVWLNNDALLLPYFRRSILFPGSESDRYVLCVAVEGDEALILDPGSGDDGGVYYVDAGELQEAMEAADGGGYLVLAPRGTTAFWRIKNDLIYASLSFYQQLSKNLEVQLSKIMRRGEVLKQVVPEAVDDFIERWRVREEGDGVTPMWTPDSNGDTQIDEFTDSS
ncbi:MAG: mechanosensitive ion channel [Candidatus Nanohaloarchaea archaeon]|nr:mechanosensitive ion channel [Candidatus Nanohaloarchaea archaeon]